MSLNPLNNTIMKKFLLTIIAMIAMTISASAQSVYISTGDGAVAYHKSKSCSYLTNSKDIKSVSTAEAKKLGRHQCTRCYGSSASAASKKTTTAKKSTAPARDEKGRFIKKTDSEKKTTTKAKKTTTPARDEKGRFIKKTDSEKKTTTKAKKTDAKKKSTKKTTKKAA